MQQKTLEIRSLAKCTDAQQRDIRLIRNQDSVRNAMYSTHIISAEEHLDWLKAVLRETTTIRSFLVFLAEVLVGAMSVSRIDPIHKTCDWAFYLSEDARGGIGKVIEFYTLNYVFFGLKLAKLNCEVLDFNKDVIAMHKTFGFRHEGTRRSEKVRGDERLDVVLLGITADEWRAEQPRIEDKYRVLLGKYA
ncbi:MAG: UDP-4-amino-4,6-dideoxy-N-acetyl-beta-L-altrosamine N-acetyltransferase, partial [Pseudomonadota bacterium]